MIAPSIPTDEAGRLAELRDLNLLDTSAEERFDRITRLATDIFDVPIAYVALVDANRQWFKSSCGLSNAESPRAESFCGHAILGDDILIIPDARADPRFVDNPMVIGSPHVRFYAGQPLRGPNGYNIGTLCTVDRRPRELTAVQLRMFKDLAGVVEREVNLLAQVALERKLVAAQEAQLVTQQLRARDLADAAAYVRSLLPAPLDGPVAADWRYIPSDELGGDAFGYQWLDPDHFALYLLDVCGHGVGAGLFSISVMNILRAGQLKGVDFRHPAQVLDALNAAFPMEEHQGRFFTMWYGVYHAPTRRLEYASAGHPPARLASPHRGGEACLTSLPGSGLPIGMMPAPYLARAIELAPGSRLFVFSDGIYEVRCPNGQCFPLSAFTNRLAQCVLSTAPRLDAIVSAMREMGGNEGFDDDVAIIEATFGQSPDTTR